MHSTLTTLLCASVLAFGASCGGEEPPPEGFHLILRLTSIDPSVLDELTVAFEPQVAAGERFMSIEPISYADGAINLEVEPDGVLVMSLTGPHVAAFVTDEDGDGALEYDLEIWSMDEQPRTPPPSVRVNGTRGGESIAQGFLYLPAWPLPNGNRSIVQVPCRPAVSDRCVP